MTSTSEQPCRLYPLADIQSATKNFDDGLVIGHGGFGKVYKGHIYVEKDIITTVAIKRLDSMSDQGAPEFRAEIEVLSRLRHAHLVSLLGCCDDDKEMILVYEYMPNGTLSNHLHNSSTPLSWMQRLRIGIGAARGLDYLHTGVGTQRGIIHRDVKSSNILLDEDWAAKISDFGLAKLCQINQLSTYVHTGIKGTFGYLDPEIFMTGKFTRKTDVFAYGVVLFELLSGRHAVLPDGDDDLSLARWAQKCVKERKLDQIVDSQIRGTLSSKSLKEFVQIGYRCLHSDPKERPTMSEVVVALQFSLALQEKFEKCAKPARLFGFTWKMPSYTFPRKKENSEDSSGYNEMLPDYKQMRARAFKIFSYDELKDATANFQNATISDRRGWVYKGWVDKKAYTSSKAASGLAIMVTSFHHRPGMDIHIMGEFCHPNLHRLLGYCLEGKTLYLVHEFMEKRSLKDHLQEGIETIPFITRVKIAVGVARGLHFLQSKQLIVEGWILDTDEIWLDKELNAKLFYFDVAMLLYRLRYPLAGHTSKRRQCDVNGLGMLLMEILRGKPFVLDYLGREHWSGEVALASNTRIEDLVDPRMILNDTDNERAQELLSLILKCTRHDYAKEQVLKELEQIYSRMTDGKRVRR